MERTVRPTTITNKQTDVSSIGRRLQLGSNTRHSFGNIVRSPTQTKSTQSEYNNAINYVYSEDGGHGRKESRHYSSAVVSKRDLNMTRSSRYPYKQRLCHHRASSFFQVWCSNKHDLKTNGQSTFSKKRFRYCKDSRIFQLPKRQGLSCVKERFRLRTMDTHVAASLA